MVVVRKNLSVSEPRQHRLFDDCRNFFDITNEPATVTAEEIVFAANDRCDQENVLAQLKASRVLHAPVDNLICSGAYMLMTALAWNLKAWLALWLPVERDRWETQPQTQQKTHLTCEFRTFVNRLVRIPCQVLQTGRKRVLRLLAWNDWQGPFFRLADALTPKRGRTCPQRCRSPRTKQPVLKDRAPSRRSRKGAHRMLGARFDAAGAALSPLRFEGRDPRRNQLSSAPGTFRRISAGLIRRGHPSACGATAANRPAGAGFGYVAAEFC